MNNNVKMSWEQFHRLWSECVGTPSYDKTAWKSIENQLERNGLLSQGCEPQANDIESNASKDIAFLKFTKYGLGNGR